LGEGREPAARRSSGRPVSAAFGAVHQSTPSAGAARERGGLSFGVQFWPPEVGDRRPKM